MFDYVVRTLCDVRHLPDLSKSLILLGTLDCNDCRYKFVDRILKLSKSALTVMKGQKLVENIYRQLSITIAGGVAIVESESDSIVL